MEILFTEQFEQAYNRLARDKKESIQKALSLLSVNPRYPSLHVKKLEGKGSIREARPSKRLRMTFEMTGNTITMRNVGEHDRVLRKP